MADLQTEPLIPLREVPKLRWLPIRRGGGRLNASTVWRWALKGLHARDGSLVKLRVLRVGEPLCTSESWVRDFFEMLTAHDPTLAESSSLTNRTPTQRQRANQQAAKELDEIGI